MIEKRDKTPKEALKRYVEAKGGRKTAYAHARVSGNPGGITVNGKSVEAYFKLPQHRAAAVASFAVVGLTEGEATASVRVHGGGIHAQAEAVRNAVARALVRWNEEYRKKLRRAGFLTRDARMVERKKYGLKKARRAPQWAKR